MPHGKFLRVYIDFVSVLSFFLIYLDPTREASSVLPPWAFELLLGFSSTSAGLLTSFSVFCLFPPLRRPVQ